MSFMIDNPFQKKTKKTLCSSFTMALAEKALQFETVCTAVVMGKGLKAALFLSPVTGNSSSEQVDAVSQSDT